MRKKVLIQDTGSGFHLEVIGRRLFDPDEYDMPYSGLQSSVENREITLYFVGEIISFRYSDIKHSFTGINDVESLKVKLDSFGDSVTTGDVSYGGGSFLPAGDLDAVFTLIDFMYTNYTVYPPSGDNANSSDISLSSFLPYLHDYGNDFTTPNTNLVFGIDPIVSYGKASLLVQTATEPTIVEAGVNITKINGDEWKSGELMFMDVHAVSLTQVYYKWRAFNPISSNAYTYFPVWAEESATIAAGATEYAYGNGDETPLTSGIVIGVDCELFACGGENEGGTGVNLEVIKNGVAVAETGVFDSNTITNLGTPVSYSAGDLVNFRTKAVTTSGASCRPVAWFRVAVKGQKGDTGADGAPGADGDMTWEGAWSAGTYLENQVVQNNGSSYVCVVASTTQQPPHADWELVAEKGDTGPSGSTAPYVHLTQTTAGNHGGSNGTVKYAEWDGTTIHKDTEFTHSTSTNPGRVTVNATGRYSLYFNVQCVQGGSARTTLMSHYRINGTTVVIRGRKRNYSRGSGYGDLGVDMTTEVDLTIGDYIEVGTTVDDSDGTYTVNSIPAECELIMRKIESPLVISNGWVQKSANYTITTDDYGIECTANSFTLTLPTATGIAGQEFKIKNMGTGVIIIDGNGSETLDGNLTISLNQYEGVDLTSNGTNWMITEF